MTFTLANSTTKALHTMALKPPVVVPPASGYKDSGSVGASGLWVPNKRETRIMETE
jgi:hypothetical protein